MQLDRAPLVPDHPFDVRELRTRHGLSQTELATLLGVHRNTVGGWENGQALTKRDFLALKSLAEKPTDVLRAQLAPKRPPEHRVSPRTELVNWLVEAAKEQPRLRERHPEAEDSPFDVLPGGSRRTFRLDAFRDLNTTTAAALVPDYAQQDIVDPLRAESRLAVFGARYQGVDSEVARQWPVTTGDASVSWVAEESAVTGDAPVYGTVSSDLKTAAARVTISRRLVSLAGPVAMDGVIESIVRSIAHDVDRVALVGLAANEEPTGVLNNGSIQQLNAASAFDGDVFLEAVRLLEVAGADSRNIGVVAHPDVKKAHGSMTFDGQHFWRASQSPTQQRAGGYPAMPLDFMPANTLLVADFSRLAIIHGVEVDLITHVANASGKTEINAFLSVDVVVPHPSGFVEITNV